MSFHLVDATYCLGERGIGGIHAVVQHSSAGRAGTDAPFVDARRRRSVYAFPSRSHLLSSRAFVSCHVRESVGHVHFHVHFSLAVRAVNHGGRVCLPHVQRRRRKRNVTRRFATEKRAKRRASATCRGVSASKECIWFVPTHRAILDLLERKGCISTVRVHLRLGVSATKVHLWGRRSLQIAVYLLRRGVHLPRSFPLLHCQSWSSFTDGSSWDRGKTQAFRAFESRNFEDETGKWTTTQRVRERERDGDHDRNGRRWRAFQAEFDGDGVGRSPTPFTRQMDGLNHHLGWNTWGRERPYTSRIQGV